MNTMQIALKTPPVFTVSRCSGRHFHKSFIVLVALVVLAVVSIAGSAVAEQGFALIGYWSTTGTDGCKSGMEFKPNGTISGLGMCPGVASMQWQARYEPSGASSFVFQVQAFQICARGGGGCQSCPGDSDACSVAQKMSIAVGEQQERRMQMQGPNQFVDQFGATWRR